VAVAIALLLVSKETLRQDQMQMILRAGHRDIEKTALFLELGGVALCRGSEGMQPSMAFRIKTARQSWPLAE
jgi:hypothetical protein